MATTRDLSLISREFENLEFPKEKRYLLKYFNTVLQVAFLKYVFVFGDYDNSIDNFVDHTGLSCRPKWLKDLYKKLKKLEAAHKEAKLNMDMEILAKIEMGKFKC